MAKDSDSAVKSKKFYIPASAKDIAKVLSLGIVAGALIVLLGEVLQRYVVNPLFCQNATGGDICGPTGLTGFFVSTILVSILSVVALARFGIFRPLLIAVGAAIALWGIKADIQAAGVLEYSFWTALLFGLTYLLLYWLLRANNFIVSLTLVTVAVVTLRLVFAM